MGAQIKLDAPMRAIDFVSLIWIIPLIFARASIDLLCKTSKSHPLYPLQWRQRIATSFLYAIRTTLNGRTTYAANTRKTTGQQVREYCAANKLGYKMVTPKVENSEFPAPNLHFVTGPNASSDGPTLLYIHGGGYVYPMVSDCHMPLVLHMGQACKAKEVVYLEYSLAPATKYPAQLSQTVEAVRYLLEQGVSPSDLVVAGDSAGVHLTTGLLAHIAKPCPSVAPLDVKSEQIRAAVLLSPWLDMVLDEKADAANEAYDVLTREQLRNSVRVLGKNPDHPWSEPLVAPDSHAVFKKVFSRAGGAKPLVGKVLVTIGDAEALFESCQEFADQYVEAKAVIMDAKGKESIADVVEQEPYVFAVGLGEVHVQPGIDIAVGYYEGGTMTALTAFMKAL